MAIPPRWPDCAGDARWWSFPNLLTALRGLLAPFVVREILAGQPRSALILLAFAAFTDYLDGAVARITRATSGIGQLLDPVADKLLLSGVFLGLAWVQTAPRWFVGIVFGRDAMLLMASAVTMTLGATADLRPSLLGKTCTVFQIVTAGLFMGASAADSSALLRTARFSVWPAAALTVASGVHYGWRGIRSLVHH